MPIEVDVHRGMRISGEDIIVSIMMRNEKFNMNTNWCVYMNVRLSIGKNVMPNRREHLQIDKNCLVK